MFLLEAESRPNKSGYETRGNRRIGQSGQSRISFSGIGGAMDLLVTGVVASLLFVFPSTGLGVFGRRSHEGIRSPLSSLANHLFYGVGVAVAVALA